MSMIFIESNRNKLYKEHLFVSIALEFMSQ